MTLRIEHVQVRRGRSRVLEPGGITASAPAAIGVVGINGSGKSSLFMHLADVLLASRSGSSIRIDGRPASVAYVPQLPALPGWLTPREVARVYGLEFDALAAAMPGLHLREIARTGVAALSAGQRQVLALALALGRAADITLLDEPFAALDFRRRIGAIDLLTALRANGRSFLLSSQAAADLVDLCDHFVVIRDGRYVFNGPRADLAGGALAIERRLLHLLV